MFWRDMGQMGVGGTSVVRASWSAQASWAEGPMSMLYDSVTRHGSVAHSEVVADKEYKQKDEANESYCIMPL